MALADPSTPSSDLGLRVLLLGSVTVRAACFAPTPWPARNAALPPAPTLTLALLLLVKVHARVQRRTLAAPHVAGRTSERRWRCPQHLWLAEAHRRLPLPAPLVDKVSCSDLDEQQQLAAAGGRGTSPHGSSPPTPLMWELVSLVLICGGPRRYGGPVIMNPIVRTGEEIEASQEKNHMQICIILGLEASGLEGRGADNIN